MAGINLAKRLERKEKRKEGTKHVETRTSSLIYRVLTIANIFLLFFFFFFFNDKSIDS